MIPLVVSRLVDTFQVSLISFAKEEKGKRLSNKCPKCQTENPDTVKFCGECGTPLVSPDLATEAFTKTLETPQRELASGVSFAQRYQVIEKLGKGGMGKVYRALDKKLDEEVAIKLLNPEIAADKKPWSDSATS